MRLIDADELIKTSVRLIYEEYTGIDELPIRFIPSISIERINNAPTVDAVLVKREI